MAFGQATGQGFVNPSEIIAQIVIIEGSRGRLLVYDGVPAFGNLILSIAGEAGTDQFGNVYGSGENVGDQAGAHLSISETGDLLIANASDEPVLFIYHGDGSIRLYNPAGIALGNLATVMSPAAGVDSAGNVYPAGITSLIAGSYYTNLQGGFLFFGSQNPASTINQDGDLTITDALVAGGVPAITLASPTSYGGATGQVQLFGEASDQSAGPQASLVVNFSDGTSSSINLFKSGGILQAFVENSVDGNNYDIQRLSRISTVDTTTTSTSPIPITGLSAKVGMGTYRIHGMIWVDMGAVGTEIRIGMSGPAATGVVVFWKNMQVAENVATSVEGSFLMTSITNFLLGPALTAGANYVIEFDGSFTFTAAGTLNIVIGEQTAGDAMTAVAGSFFDLMPVTQ